MRYVLAICIALIGCEDTRTLGFETNADDGMSVDGTDASSALDGADGRTATNTSSSADDIDGIDNTSGMDTSTGLATTDGSSASDASDSVDSSDSVDGIDAVDGISPQSPLPPRTCTHRISYDTFGQSISSVAVAGEFNEWNSTTTLLSDEDGDGVYHVNLDTTDLAGSYAYKLVVDGESWLLDPANPMRKMVDGVENSKLLIENCSLPLLEVETLEYSKDNITAVIAVRDGASEAGILSSTATMKLGTQLASNAAYVYDEASQRFVVDIDSPADGKHSLTFFISNNVGAARPLHLPLWVEAEPFEWADAVMYFAMTDRFRDAQPNIGGPVACIPNNNANWLGGDWAGVTEKIEDGYFTNLGVTALWLTAVVDNPDTCMSGSLGKTYTSYHGYFPSSQRTAENQLGSLADLKGLVDAAHAKGIRVLVDLVANHLHSSHPLVTEQPSQGWFNAFFQCGFDEAPLTCWFEEYLPDLNYESDSAVEEMTEAAIWWVLEADLDGFRIDAVKHMHDNFLYTVRAKIDRDINVVPGTEFYTVGETYVGDWGGGSGPNETVLKQYINHQMLHGQFDFPLYWRILRVFARDQEDPAHLTDLLTQSEGYYGSKAVMSRFLGNHDVPRFISHATGHISDEWGTGAKQLGWDSPPTGPVSVEPYQRLMLAWSFLFTIEGIPLIYYGDEIGLPGAGDPDNRRMMIWDDWTSNNTMVHEHVALLASIRKAYPALSRGTTEVLLTNSFVMAYRRVHSSGDVVVVLNRSQSTQTVPLNLTGNWTDALGGGAHTGSVTVPGFGALILSQ